MMARVGRWLFGLLVATVLGLGSAVGALHLYGERGTLRVGVWQTSTTAGSVSSSLYERAGIAIHALFVLSRKETIYYRTYRDSSGQLLHGDCDYVIRGVPPSARWWSLTVYGEDDYLVANPANRYSFSATSLPLEADGSFRIAASAVESKGNWLPIPRGRRFSLTLRLYNPGPGIAEHPESVALPVLEGKCP